MVSQKTKTALKYIAIYLVLVVPLVLLRATSPYPITLSTETGHTPPLITASQYDNNALNIRNIYTTTITNTSTGAANPLWIFNQTTSGQDALRLQRNGTQAVAFNVATAGHSINYFESDGTTFAGETGCQTDGLLCWLGTDGTGGALDLYSSGVDLTLTASNGAVFSGPGGPGAAGGMIRLVAATHPPVTCDAGHLGTEYTDDSSAKCWCDGSAWQKIIGAGSCS